MMLKRWKTKWLSEWSRSKPYFLIEFYLSGDITFTDVFVPEKNKLAKANDFNAANSVLEYSRIYICW